MAYRVERMYWGWYTGWKACTVGGTQGGKNVLGVVHRVESMYWGGGYKGGNYGCYIGLKTGTGVVMYIGWEVQYVLRIACRVGNMYQR